MTGCMEVMIGVVECTRDQNINLPTSQTSLISHCGNVKLKNVLMLKNVLHIPSFKHNLLSVQKLSKDENIKIEFHSEFCVLNEKDREDLWHRKSSSWSVLLGEPFYE